MSPVNFFGGRSKADRLDCMYLCGHRYTVKVHPDTSPAHRAIIEADCAELLCPACRRKQLLAERKARKR